MIWNPCAVDYSQGITITDPETGLTYTEEQARNLPEDIRKRLINKPNKIGCFVKDINGE